jgi:hypothetical protein
MNIACILELFCGEIVGSGPTRKTRDVCFCAAVGDTPEIKRALVCP